MSKDIKLLIILTITLSQLGCSSVSNATNTYEKYKPKMQFIHGGTLFIKINGKASTDQKKRKVSINSFWMAKTETTYSEWQACVNAGGCQSNKHPLRKLWELREDEGISLLPIVGVNWHDANEYTRWLSRVTGKNYRLPTKAEWRYAAQAGKTTLFPWGNTVIGTDKANCRGCKSPWGDISSAPVGSFKPYGGLYDMYGNVLEWTCSLSGRYSDTFENENICAKSSDNRYRSLLGGSFGGNDLHIVYADKPSSRNEYIGFRVIRTN